MASSFVMKLSIFGQCLRSHMNTRWMKMIMNGTGIMFPMTAAVSASG